MADLLCLDLVEKGLVTSTLGLYVGYSKDTFKSSHGTISMSVTTSSVPIITQYFTQLYQRIVNRSAPIRRINIEFINVIDEAYEQYDLFTDPKELERSRKIQHAVLNLKKKYGKNAVLKGMNLQTGATTIERNRQIGGHRSGES